MKGKAKRGCKEAFSLERSKQIVRSDSKTKKFVIVLIATIIGAACTVLTVGYVLKYDQIMK